MKFLRYWIYSVIILGLIFLIRVILSALFGLFMESPETLSTILAFIIVLGISIWYIDWNMKR